MKTDKQVLRNRYCFGLGTVGRDMLYSLVSMYLINYITGVIGVSNKGLGIITALMMVFRVFDALNDPVMGTIVDNTKTRWGKFKPWILFGMIASGILTILLFTDFGLAEGQYIALFAVVYLCWGMAYTTNDIAYWSIMPALTKDQNERERIGSFARICASVGMFSVVILYTQIPTILAPFGDKCYLVFTLIVVAIMWFFQIFTVLGVKEDRSGLQKQEHTSLGDMVRVLFKNDQLMVTAVAMALFMIGYCTTTSFGVYYFRYAYQDENMYMVFAGVLAVAQLTALSLFPKFAAKWTRKQLYFGAMVAVCVAYILFFIAPFQNIVLIAVSGLILFFAQAFIQTLMLVFLADTVEYGHWKLGKRNESVTFAVQPFINKLGGAVGSGVVGLTLILSGINDIEQQYAAAVTTEAKLAAAATVQTSSLWMMKVAMLIFPLICIVIGFILYQKKYMIDKEMYDKIVAELKERE